MMRFATLRRAAPLLCLLMLAACKSELYAQLPEQEANQMISVLQQHGIAAEKETAKDGTESILVDKSSFAQAVQILRDNGLPRKQYDSIGDVFKQNGLVASPLQDRARFLYALSQELSSTISDIDGVLTARVEVVLPDNDIMQRTPTPSSASVFVRYDSKSNVAQLVPQIKMLVANSVEGLSYDKVSVVLVPVTRTTDMEPNAAVSHGSSVATILEVIGAIILLIAGLGFIYRDKLQDLINKRGGKLPTIWHNH